MLRPLRKLQLPKTLKEYFWHPKSHAPLNRRLVSNFLPHYPFQFHWRKARQKELCPQPRGEMIDHESSLSALRALLAASS
jgi:hypothetical protein